MTREIKFQLSDLLGVGMTLVVLGIGLTYGLDVIADVRDDQAEDYCDGLTLEGSSYSFNASSGNCFNSTVNATSPEVAPASAEFNASANAITGVAKIPEKLPTIATVVVAAVIIGIVVRFLFVRFSG